MSSQYQPGLIYCEMVKMDPLVRHDKKTLELLDFTKDMHPIGGQICGSKAEYAGPSAKIIEELGFDVVDLNCGCPVDKVTKDGSGSGLLKNPQLIGDIITNMVAAVKIPVTVKIRAGWDEQSINALEVMKIAEEAGAAAICIHGRTREQAYRGPANWDWVTECKKQAKSILVIGNGDLFNVDAVENMFTTTNCDAVLVARGTMGQPWIAQDIYNYYDGLPVVERTPMDRLQGLIEHYEKIKAYRDPRKALLDMRRVCCWYIKSATGAAAFRGAINHAESLDSVKELIHSLMDQCAEKCVS